MKKIFFFTILVLSLSSIKAQQIPDALRYSQDNLNGTARFQAMGGAFGALGGDLSGVTINPAGSAVFINNFSSLTLSNANKANTSTFYGTTNKMNESTFDMNQFGAVWVFSNYNPESKWSKFTLAMNYDKVNNFRNATFAQGFNPNNSIAGYFTSYANGIPVNVLNSNSYNNLTYQEQQGFLGLQGGLIQSIGGNQYASAVNTNGNYYQENRVETLGFNSKIAFNIATEYDKRFYFGLNLNAHFTDFRSTASFYEDYQDSPGNNPSTGVQASRFINELYTYGSGFSFQLGAIAKVTNELRLGVAFESPTWYNLNDELQQILSINCPSCTPRDDTFFAGPNTIIVYPTYRLQTPAKYSGSLAYVFGSAGLISIDYGLKDYSTSRFRPSVEFTDANMMINSELGLSNELRVGAEYRIKKWSLRGGYRFEESPFKNKTTVGDLNSVSTGFGYNFGMFKLDLAYSYVKRENNEPFFTQGFTDAARIETVQNNVTLTLGFEL